jgi:arylsulfatase A-like enzyme
MNRIKTRIRGWFRSGAVLAGTIALLPELPAAEPAAPPNIVVLFVDDLGWADVGFQGPHHKTPHIDALAASGMVFTRAYTAAPTCSPSRSGLVTGRHPAELGVVRHLPERNPEGREFSPSVDDPAGLPSRNRLPAGAQTYGHALQRLGYRTAHHGKWHLGDEKYHPTQWGFHEQVGTTNRGLVVSHLAPFWPDNVYTAVPPGTYLADQQTADAIAYIKANATRRFLLNLWYYGVHTPVIGRPKYVAEAKARGLSDQMAEYDGMVRAVDDSVGRIVRALEEAGLREKTLVLLTSDQGSYFERPPLRGSKIRTTAGRGCLSWFPGPAGWARARPAPSPSRSPMSFPRSLRRPAGIPPPIRSSTDAACCPSCSGGAGSRASA